MAVETHRLSVSSSAGPTSSSSRLVAYTDGGFRGEHINQQTCTTRVVLNQQETNNATDGIGGAGVYWAGEPGVT